MNIDGSYRKARTSLRGNGRAYSRRIHRWKLRPIGLPLLSEVRETFGNMFEVLFFLTTLHVAGTAEAWGLTSVIFSACGRGSKRAVGMHGSTNIGGFCLAQVGTIQDQNPPGMPRQW